MKKYLVVTDYFTFEITARNPASAAKKAVRRLQDILGDKSITLDSVVSVKYLGFYIGRKFVGVQS